MAWLITHLNQKWIRSTYQHLWSAHGDDIFAVLDESLAPRPPAVLYEPVRELGINDTYQVLDVGCGRGNHVCQLALRFGCRVVGLDPVVSNLEQGRKAAGEIGVADKDIDEKGTNCDKQRQVRYDF